MPLFKVGNFDQLTLSFAPTARAFNVQDKAHVKFPKTLTLAALGETSFKIEPPAMDLAKSSQRWALRLKSLSLYESFEGLIANLFKPTNNIYFMSIAWDYSGRKPFIYPPRGARASEFIIPMKAKTTREFIGDGVLLWPAQAVAGALNLVLLVYESDQNERALGDQFGDLHDKVTNSKLASLIAAISANPSLATGVAIGAAVTELIGVIGNIMKRNGDDYVDLFEGSYGTDKAQQAGIQKYDQEAVGIELEFSMS